MSIYLLFDKKQRLYLGEKNNYFASRDLDKAFVFSSLELAKKAAIAAKNESLAIEQYRLGKPVAYPGYEVATADVVSA